MLVALRSRISPAIKDELLRILVHHDQIAKASACRPARDLAHLKPSSFWPPMKLCTREYTHKLLAKFVAHACGPLFGCNQYFWRSRGVIRLEVVREGVARNVG